MWFLIILTRELLSYKYWENIAKEKKKQQEEEQKRQQEEQRRQYKLKQEAKKTQYKSDLADLTIEQNKLQNEIPRPCPRRCCCPR